MRFVERRVVGRRGAVQVLPIGEAAVGRRVLREGQILRVVQLLLVGRLCGGRRRVLVRAAVRRCVLRCSTVAAVRASSHTVRRALAEDAAAAEHGVDRRIDRADRRGALARRLAGVGVAAAVAAVMVRTSSRGHLPLPASHPFAGCFACSLAGRTGERRRARTTK